MRNNVIEVEDISKLYRLGEVGTGSIAHDLNRWFAKLQGKEDPYSIVGQVNDRTKFATSNFAWALKNVSFKVQKGEVLGIIGKNGAGKSTLLKILSQITSPTSGEIKVKGRIASLLEVGTGMHPEMTARENIFLNGAILGMTKAEIRSKFDEIVDFSGCALYVDTPIKRFSSGMRVRLGFAVAAFLEPEILIVDEVLAVGDAEFQSKAIGKMKDVSRSEGRTILFVSHNLTAVRQLCTSAVIMENGTLSAEGKVEEIIEHYIKSDSSRTANFGKIEWAKGQGPGEDEVKLLSIKLLNEELEPASVFYTTNEIKVEVNYEVAKLLQGSRLVLQLLDSYSNVVFSSTNHDTENTQKLPGSYSAICTIPKDLLNRGQYYVKIQIGIPGVKVLIKGEVFLSFKTILLGNHGSTFNENWLGVVAPRLNWENKSITA